MRIKEQRRELASVPNGIGMWRIRKLSFKGKLFEAQSSGLQVVERCVSEYIPAVMDATEREIADAADGGQSHPTNLARHNLSCGTFGKTDSHNTQHWPKKWRRSLRLGRTSN